MSLKAFLEKLEPMGGGGGGGGEGCGRTPYSGMLHLQCT